MQRRGRFWALILTASLVGLIALSVAASQSYLSAVVVISIAVIVGVFRRVFHSSRAFCLTLANLIAVYACLFLFFIESNFRAARFGALAIAFAMPLVAFTAGSFRHRMAHRRMATDEMRDEPRVLHIFAWLLPVFAVGSSSFLLPSTETRGLVVDGALLAAMTAISAIVFVVSRDITEFLLDTGLLFDEFFQRSARLAVPAFAFLTFYSLLVILFAAFYAVLDHALGGIDFRIDGVLRAISFPEALYFSLMTLSTVGYGDIAPASDAIRLVASIEIVCGVLLLLFGFNEIFSFARSQEQSVRQPTTSPTVSARTSARRNSLRNRSSR